MTRRHHIERIYQNHGEPFDNLWEYALKGDSKKERYLRFRELERWATHKRRPKNRSGDTWEQWDNRHDAYRRQKRKILTRLRRNDHPATGTGAWGGSQSIIDREVIPVYTRYGVPVTSTKRSWSPGSDHFFGSLTAYAADGGTFAGAPVAGAVAKNLGIGNYSTGNYNNYYISRAGKQFRIQILWAVADHFNHVHTGARS